MDAAALALPFLFALIAVALAFDFLNGMNDAANSIATIVSTRVLRPHICGRLGGIFQFHRLHVLRPACRRNGRPRHRRGGCRQCPRDLRRAGRRHRLADRHAAAGHPVVELARADRRPGRGRYRQGGHPRGGLVGRRQDRRRHLPVAGARPGARADAHADGVVDIRALGALRRRQSFPPPPVHIGLGLRARPRRQRRAEDHGHHRRAALFARHSGRRNSTSRSGW